MWFVWKNVAKLFCCFLNTLCKLEKFQRGPKRKIIEGAQAAPRVK